MSTQKRFSTQESMVDALVRSGIDRQWINDHVEFVSPEAKEAARRQNWLDTPDPMDLSKAAMEDRDEEESND